MTSARDVILERIRAANHGVAPANPVAPPYHRIDERSRTAILEDFERKLRDYNVVVRRTGEDGLPATIAGTVAARKLTSLAIPKDLPEAWRPTSVELRIETALDHRALDATDGALTGCALAIAETGTIILDGGSRQGRRVATLIPDYHLCVVYADQVVGLVAEAIDRLGKLAAASNAPITFISGPSATADIELQRVVGVHGPRTLEVVIVAA